MGQTLSRIRYLYSYEDGDNIEARMGVIIDDGYGLTQYWDVNQQKVVNTDFTKHPAVLYPLPYSSKLGQYVRPETQGQQWYFNNPETTTAAILDDKGAVKDTYKDRFELTTTTVDGTVYPALKIKGNIAKADDLTDKYIYYKSSYNGKPFTAAQLINVQTTTGDATELIISMESQNGVGSTALTNSNKWVKMTAHLLKAGTNIDSNATFQWQRFVGGTWVNVVNSPTVMELNGTQELKVYTAGVDCEEVFRVACVSDGKTKYQSVQLTDQTDSYYIFDGCSNVGDAVDENTDVTFTPAVYTRTGNVPDTENTWKFSFYMYNMANGNELADYTKKNVSTYKVNYSVLRENKGVSVIISATNE